MAERLRGAGHRLDPTRVPRSGDRDERGGAAPGTSGLRLVLHAVANTSCARQGDAVPSPGQAGVSRSHYRHSRSGRSPSPLRPHRRIAVAQCRSQLQPTAPPVRSTVCVAFDYRGCPRSREQRLAYGENCRKGLQVSKWSAVFSSRLFRRHNSGFSSMVPNTCELSGRPLRVVSGGAKLTCGASSLWSTTAHRIHPRRVQPLPTTSLARRPPSAVPSYAGIHDLERRRRSVEPRGTTDTARARMWLWPST
jgi:hypothetical protein